MGSKKAKCSVRESGSGELTKGGRVGNNTHKDKRKNEELGYFWRRAKYIEGKLHFERCVSRQKGSFITFCLVFCLRIAQ